MAQKIIPILIVLFFSVWSGLALLHPGLPPTHDGEYHVIRFYEFYKTFISGTFYPVWAQDLNNGYGLPLFNYVYPFPNYISAILHLFGLGFIDSFKANLFIASVIGGLFFFFWSRVYWSTYGALVSTIFYLFAPYRFVDIYIRGSVGEVWALAFFPAFLWAITSFAYKPKRLNFSLSSIFLSFIIFSHNILGLMFFGFIVIYMSFLITNLNLKGKTILEILLILFLGLCISIVFWLPALFESQYVVGLKIYDVTKNFPELYQLLIPSWGSGFVGGDLKNQLSLQIGIANLIVVFATFFCLIFQRKHKHIKLVIMFLAIFLIVFFLMLPYSAIIWTSVPLMNYFQFPWRLLSLEIVIAAFLAGFVATIWEPLIFTSIFIILVVSLSINYMHPAFYHDRLDSYYITRSNFIDGTNSPGNSFNTIWFDTSLKKQNTKLGKNRNITIISSSISPTEYYYAVKSKKSTNAIINASYYPGWKVFVDGKQTAISQIRGVIHFRLAKGNHSILVIFTDTIVRAISKLISILGIILLVIFTWRGINNGYRN